MTAVKDNPKKYARNARRAVDDAGEVLELNTDNFLIICGLNGLRPVQVPALIERSKQAIYMALRDPQSCPIVFDRLEQVLPKRRLPNDN